MEVRFGTNTYYSKTLNNGGGGVSLPFFRGTEYFISSRTFEQTKTVPFTSVLMKWPFNPRATSHQKKLFQYLHYIFATRHVWEGLHAPGVSLARG